MTWQSQPSLTLVTAPATEPITTTDAKTYLRVTGTTDDALIAAFITAARVWAENYTRRALITQTWDQRFAGFFSYQRPLVLAKAPAQSVTSVTYLDPDNVTQTLDTTYYNLVTMSGPQAGRAWIESTDAMQVPALSLSGTEYPVTVRTVCGYGNAASVPQGIIAAIYLMLGDLYEQRQETIVGTITSKTHTTIERLLGPYRLPEAS